MKNYTLKELESQSTFIFQKLCMTAHTYNGNTQEAEVR